jgi:tRNA threonylcarbamoyladenosine biosynthesis protein TsaB
VKLLALDTSSLACSVALQVGDAVVERHEEASRQHTRLLMPMIRTVLEESQVDLRDLDAIILGNGPGSFIGMRIAASVAQGLAFASGLSVVPVSSLAAVAAQVFDRDPADEAVVAQDAHMSEVYLGIFGRDDAGLPVARGGERLHGIGRIEALAAGRPDRRVAAGEGWVRYPQLQAVNREFFTAIMDLRLPRAGYLLPLGAAGLRAGLAIPPQDISPAYLRQKVAQAPPPLS